MTKSNKPFQSIIFPILVVILLTCVLPVSISGTLSYPQDNPSDWWIPLLKKHNLDISKKDFKKFYKFGSVDLGYDNALVIGNAPVITPSISNYKISDAILILRINQNEYHIIKAQTCDIQFAYNVLTYYKGTLETFTFDKMESTRNFPFKRLELNVKNNRIKTKTDSGNMVIE